MRLVVFGLGFTAGYFVRRHGGAFDTVTATVRDMSSFSGAPEGVELVPFSDHARIARALGAATHILVSVPPCDEGDPVLLAFGDIIARAPHLEWIGYLSTIGVYGDAGGAWIDESAKLDPTSARNRRRVEVEAAWRSLSDRLPGAHLQVFRLAGIYGPGRNALVNMLEGKARRIVKPGQVFNRVHVEDIAAALRHAIDRPDAGPMFNITDNEPAPPQDVVALAADLLGMPVPPDIAFAEADLSPMGRSFYSENKRVSNRLMREALGVEPVFPTYREGLRACLAELPAQGF